MPEPNVPGRPLKFKTPEDLQIAIDDYFQWCDNKTITIQHAFSKGITETKTPTPYTMSGLAVHLKCDRQTLLNYNKKEEYFGAIMHARTRIETDNVIKGLLKIHDSKICELNLCNNYGFSRKSEVNVNETLEITLSDEALDRAISMFMGKIEQLQPPAHRLEAVSVETVSSSDNQE